MRRFLEIVGAIVVFGGFVVFLAWIQVKVDRALLASRRAGRGFFDAGPPPTDP